MRANHQSVRTRKGFVSVYMAFSSLLLIPMVGLAIDFSVLYSVRARLQTAVDAAAIGSGSTLNRGAIMDIPAVTDVAQRFFDANYPTGYWGSSPVFPVSITPLQGALGIRTITINASEHVPMLFLRVLGINQSTVAATGQVTVRFVNVMLVVDRSGSVWRATYTPPGGVLTHTYQTVANDLREFVDPCDLASSPGCASLYFSDGRDYIGMVTFGASWREDFPLSLNFQSNASHIGTAIDNIDWDTNNGTNTADGLFHGYRKLVDLAQPGALNVIVLLTDGRPTSFSGSFPVSAASPCTDRTNKLGVISTPVGWPPGTTGTTTGVLQTKWVAHPPGLLENTNIVTNNSHCSFAGSPNNMSSDISTIPNKVGAPDDNPLNLTFFTTQATNSDLTTFTGGGSATSSPLAIRYSSFNVADNVATMIRTDNGIKPVIFVIGLNNNNGEESLDADWLARVANDRDYLNTVTHLPVYQSTQPAGKYYDVTAGGISAALRDIASQILRLSK